MLGRTDKIANKFAYDIIRTKQAPTSLSKQKNLRYTLATHAAEHMMPSRKAISLCKKIINGQTSSDMAVEEIKRDYGAESGYRHDGWFWTLRCICCG